MKIYNSERKEWTKIWSGNWSFLTCFYFGTRYSTVLKAENQVFSEDSIFLINKGHSSGFVPEEARQVFGKKTVSMFSKHPEAIDELALELKRRVDDILKYINEMEKKVISASMLEEFFNQIDAYFIPHVYVKYIVDFLPKELLEKKIEFLQSARVYAEPVFKRTEDIMNVLANQISVKTKYKPEHILSTTLEEMQSYLLGKNSLPSEEELTARYDQSALIFNKEKWSFVTKNEVKEIEKILFPKPEENIIKGSTAYPGKVSGIVKIIFDPSKADHFKEGDILVTGMTRPEYLHLMEKASAFVTDAGGILSHAAIVARELKKPCIIGTKIATKVLKDGDKIEVDANLGIIKIIK